MSCSLLFFVEGCVVCWFLNFVERVVFLFDVFRLRKYVLVLCVVEFGYELMCREMKRLVWFLLVSEVCVVSGKF